jgi:mRNA-degrading endonuclease RelE of RelBE toxin-antitoxin system
MQLTDLQDVIQDLKKTCRLIYKQVSIMILLKNKDNFEYSLITKSEDRSRKSEVNHFRLRTSDFRLYLLILQQILFQLLH